MQEQVNEKTIALYIKTGKLTADTLQKAMKSLLSGHALKTRPPKETTYAYLIVAPICLSSRHCGASPSSPQYSSTDTILSSLIWMNDTA